MVASLLELSRTKYAIVRAEHSGMIQILIAKIVPQGSTPTMAVLHVKCALRGNQTKS
jgi:hypothetical protein